ncbi:maleylpyruvate isomerase family protein [Candidatus Gracilibacteria bacterium]|nr:maleylpyruvate isomerase family protein [Candidatus Gracilibacteria bacterium]
MQDHELRTTMLAALDAEYSVLMARCRKYDGAQLRAAVRADGWTAHDILAHVADATYGLSLLTLGEAQPTLPTDPQTGYLSPHEYNEQRRQKNADLSVEKLLSRLESAFATARRAIAETSDLAADGPYGPPTTRHDWLQRIVDHAQGHREELAELL